MPNSNASSGHHAPTDFRLQYILLAAMLCVVFNIWWSRESMLARTGLEYAVPQGGNATFSAESAHGPTNGRCEIVAPDGAVVASFVSIAGGSDNGWRAQVKSQGWNARPLITIEAPKNAPLGNGYRISTASYLWPQSSALFDVMAKDAPAVSPNPAPWPTKTKPIKTAVPKADLTIRNAGQNLLGRNLYGDEAEGQTVEQVAVLGKSSLYFIIVQNQSDTPAAFKLKAQSSGQNWQIRYFDVQSNGSEISRAITDVNGWETPILAVRGSVAVSVEIQAEKAADVAATTLLSVSNLDGVPLDAVRATASRQSIARIEVSTDHGKTWKVATSRGITVPESTVVGFRAIKKIANLPWPNEPLQPQWHTAEATHFGDDIWIQGDAGQDTALAAECGNLMTTKFHVTPDEPSARPRKYLQRKD